MSANSSSRGGTLLSLLLLLGVWQPLTAQDLPAPRLRVKSTAVIEGRLFADYMVQSPLKCDADGNVYLRWYQKGFSTSPIVRISSDGKETSEFSVRSVPGYEKGVAYDFALGPRSELYLLGRKDAKETHILRFNSDGGFETAFTLEPGLAPSRIAVFHSGEFLVSGRELSPKRRRTGRLLLALYDRRGQFIREISLPRDLQVAPDSPDVKGDDPRFRKAESAFSSSNLIPADDGNIYLSRATARPVVYVITPAGLVERRLLLEPPGENFHAGTMKVAAGRIVMQYYTKNPDGPGSVYIFSVFDAYTGEKFADYSSPSPEEGGGAWACYTPDGFTLLGSTGKPRRLALIHASPY